MNIKDELLSLLPSPGKEVLDHDMCSLSLWKKLPKDQIDMVMSGNIDIEPQFLGFVSTYLLLSFLIPKHFTVIDLGCAYAPQCFYFSDHKQYVGVDLSVENRFHTDNTTMYTMSISNFIKDYIELFDLDTTFAICNYVPEWRDDNMKLIRENFKNVFVFYPASERG